MDGMNALVSVVQIQQKSTALEAVYYYARFVGRIDDEWNTQINNPMTTNTDVRTVNTKLLVMLARVDREYCHPEIYEDLKDE